MNYTPRLIFRLNEHKFHDKWRYIGTTFVQGKTTIHFAYGQPYICPIAYKDITIDLNDFYNSKKLIEYLDKELEK